MSSYQRLGDWKNRFRHDLAGFAAINAPRQEAEMYVILNTAVNFRLQLNLLIQRDGALKITRVSTRIFFYKFGIASLNETK